MAWSKLPQQENNFYSSILNWYRRMCRDKNIDRTKLGKDAA